MDDFEERLKNFKFDIGDITEHRLSQKYASGNQKTVEFLITGKAKLITQAGEQNIYKVRTINNNEYCCTFVDEIEMELEPNYKQQKEANQKPNRTANIREEIEIQGPAGTGKIAVELEVEDQDYTPRDKDC